MINIIDMMQSGKSLTEVNEAIKLWNDELWATNLSEGEKRIIKTRVTAILAYAKTIELTIEDKQPMWDWSLNRLINGGYKAQPSEFHSKMQQVNDYARSLGYDELIPSSGPSLEYMREVFWEITNER